MGTTHSLSHLLLPVFEVELSANDSESGRRRGALQLARLLVLVLHSDRIF